MPILISSLVSATVAFAVAVASFFFVSPEQLVRQQIQEIRLGAATEPFAGTVYTLAGSGVSGSATSIIFTSLTVPQTGYEILDADLSDTFYITLEPGSRTRQEIVSCTTVTQSGSDNTATLSGCTRGLLPFPPYTASSTYQFAHGGGTSAVFSNPPQFYEEFTAKGNNEDITGQWSFPSSSPARATSSITYGAGSEEYFATKRYVDAVATSGVADASYTTAGKVEIATKAQTSAGTATDGTGALLVPQNVFFNATSSATTTIPVTKTNGKLSQSFLDFTEAWTFSATTTAASSSVFNGTTDFNGITTFNGSVVTNGAFGGSSLISASTANVNAAASSTATLLSVSIPANTLGTANVVRSTLNLEINKVNATGYYAALNLSYGTSSVGTSTLSSGSMSLGTYYGKIEVILQSAGATDSQEATLTAPVFAPDLATSTTQFYIRGTANQDSTQAKTLVVTLTTYGEVTASSTQSFTEAIKTQN